jgi:hypothetical protein
MSVVSKDEIIRIFQKSNRFGLFKASVLNLGFKINDKGCNKFVFIHPRLPWVIKLVFGQPEQLPDPRSKISQYFLWPEMADAKLWVGEYYELWFQPKVNCRGYRKDYLELMEIFKRNKINWIKDNHNWNVGRYQGRPVIFDY